VQRCSAGRVGVGWRPWRSTRLVSVAMAGSRAGVPSPPFSFTSAPAASSLRTMRGSPERTAKTPVERVRMSAPGRSARPRLLQPFATPTSTRSGAPDLFGVDSAPPATSSRRLRTWQRRRH
jgi:hypothetical protein